jgi:protein-disulfide isomerase
VVVLAAVTGVVVQANRSAGAASGVAPHHLLGPGDSEVEGSATAPVLVEEYGDYQCPVCGRFHAQVGPTIEALVNAGTIRFAFHPFAFIGAESTNAAAAAECAGDDGHYFAMWDQLYDNQFPENSDALTTDELVGLAQQAGVSSPSALSCIRSGVYRGWVRKVTDEGSRRGVTATPTVFVNGLVIIDPTVEALTAAVQQAAKT